jgi:hypothetical protein
MPVQPRFISKSKKILFRAYSMERIAAKKETAVGVAGLTTTCPLALYNKRLHD